MREMEFLQRKQEAQDREIRALKLRLDKIANSQGIRETAITGVGPPSGGGTGIVGSPLGVTMWKNDSGATRSQGTVVVSAPQVGITSNEFGVTTTILDEDVIGVLDDDNIAVGQFGRVRHIGYQSKVLVTGVVALGDLLAAYVTAGRATVTPTGRGAFAKALSTNPGGVGQVEAFIFAYSAFRPSPVRGLMIGKAGAITAGADTSDFYLPVPYDCQATGIHVTVKTLPGADVTVQLRRSIDGGVTWGDLSASANATLVAAGPSLLATNTYSAVALTGDPNPDLLGFSLTGGGGGSNLAASVIVEQS